jgi:CheY-like chemotaxis protein
MSDVNKNIIGNESNQDEEKLEELSQNELLSKNFKKILVVDDIMYVVKSISKILRDEGYFVITAMSGNEALTKYTKFMPDLITIDQKLPDMTGMQLVDKIRQINVGYKPKIVFISAVYDKEEIKNILNLEIDNYLLKPFKKNKLAEMVKEILG